METNAYAVETPTLIQRVMRRLFPSASVPPFDEMPGFAAGEIVSNTRVRLDFADRIRVLVSGRVAVDTRHKTDVAVSKVVSASVFYVPAPGSKE